MEDGDGCMRTPTAIGSLDALLWNVCVTAGPVKGPSTPRRSLSSLFSSLFAALVCRIVVSCVVSRRLRHRTFFYAHAPTVSQHAETCGGDEKELSEWPSLTSPLQPLSGWCIVALTLAGNVAASA
jgi:hypothetical protein